MILVANDRDVRVIRVDHDSDVVSSFAMTKKLTYVELPANDMARSATFYAAVLGWQIDQRADGPRFSDDTAQLIGRWVIGRASTREPGVMLYFSVDRVADAVARVAANGGEVIAEPTIEGDVLLARLRDPAGNAIGIWQFASA